jgi:16S rRNA C1402 (ribose-2'-O) methylase RsmI
MATVTIKLRTGEVITRECTEVWQSCDWLHCDEERTPRHLVECWSTDAPVVEVTAETTEGEHASVVEAHVLPAAKPRTRKRK